MTWATNNYEKILSCLSFRVYCATLSEIARVTYPGIDTEALRADYASSYKVSSLRVLAAGFSRYCARDPGFFFMFWNVTRSAGRKPSLPAELLKLVFEALYD